MNKLLFTLVILLFSCLCKSQNIDKESALADFNEFVELLEIQSSYFQVSDYNFEGQLLKVKQAISTQDSVPIRFLAFQMEKIIAETVDRHASVKIEDLDEDNIEMLHLHLPFSIAPLHDQAVALIKNKSSKKYKYYSSEYPFIKSINGSSVIEFIEHYAYKRKNSPEAAKLYDGIKDLRDVGELFFMQGELSHAEIDFVLTNGTTDKKITLPLSKRKNRWTNIGYTQDIALIKADYFGEQFNYNKLNKWIGDSIGYLLLPAMFSYDDFPDLETHLKAAIDEFKDANAIVIDIRGNGGGSRDILNTLSGYIVTADQSPWLANVAYIRNNQQLNEDIESMSSRYLYCYNSEKLTDDDRDAIDVFEHKFKTDLIVDSRKFSEPFYMVLKNNGTNLTSPIYVLADEQSFSAASVFASALKGLTNVKIVGVTTNGSSGRSREFYLTNSNIRIKLSTMLSFQRNGKTLDGNGTKPDLVLKRDELQIFGERDSQLDGLINWIKTN